MRYLHLCILSYIPASILTKTLKKHANYDLKQSLADHEDVLQLLIASLNENFSLFVSSIQPLYCEKSLRTAFGKAMQPKHKIEATNLIYIILYSGDKIVNVVKPKNHVIHPADLHILQCRLSVCTSTQSSWLPVCLPKLSDGAFIFAYICKLTSKNDMKLVLVSRSRDDYPNMQVIHNFIEEGIKPLPPISSPEPIAIVQELKHYVYKSKAFTQVTTSTSSNLSKQALELIHSLWAKAHTMMHINNVKFVFARSSYFAVLAWSTPTFELYMAFDQSVRSKLATAAANSLVRWISLHESGLFLQGSPILS